MMDAVHGGGLGGTYGGNPVACAAALGAIETMQAEDLCGAARHIESVMRPRLAALADEVPGRSATSAGAARCWRWSSSSRGRTTPTGADRRRRRRPATARA